MLSEWLRERVLAHFGERYSRDDRFVHVHELLYPAHSLPSLRSGDERRRRMGYLLVGEAFELGLRELLGAAEAPRSYRGFTANRGDVSSDVVETLRRAGVTVSADASTIRIIIDGQTDMLVLSDPDGVVLWEVKTTRTSKKRGYKMKWRIQAKLYAWLYGAPVRLLVFNINSGDIDLETEVFEPNDWWAECYLAEWLRGELYPWVRCGV